VSLRFDVVTLFPEMFAALTASGITRRALERGLWQIECWNPRQWTQDVHRTVDDRPYGGGPVMVMLASPLEQAIDAAKAAAKVGAGGTAETRVIDRSFVEDGVRWIIDYKTADLGPEADAARLAAHAERYRSQLESYAGLFAGERRPRRLAVFYVAHGILASLEYNSSED